MAFLAASPQRHAQGWRAAGGTPRRPPKLLSPAAPRHGCGCCSRSCGVSQIQRVAERSESEEKPLVFWSMATEPGRQRCAEPTASPGVVVPSRRSFCRRRGVRMIFPAITPSFHSETRISRRNEDGFACGGEEEMQALAASPCRGGVCTSRDSRHGAVGKASIPGSGPRRCPSCLLPHLGPTPTAAARFGWHFRSVSLCRGRAALLQRPPRAGESWAREAAVLQPCV